MHKIKVSPLSVWLCKTCKIITFAFRSSACPQCRAGGNWWEEDFEIVKIKLIENGHELDEDPEYHKVFESLEGVK